MKFSNYRSASVARKLQDAVATWQRSSPGNILESRPVKSFSDRIQTALWYLLFPLFLVPLHTRNDEGILLSFYLLFISSAVTSAFQGLRWTALSSETNHLLPISNGKLAKQTLRQFFPTFFVGLLFALICGWFTNTSKSPLQMSVAAGLVYLALVGILSLSVLPKSGRLNSWVLFGSFSLGFLYSVFGPVQDFVSQIAPWNPWVQALHSWPHLFAFLAIGILVASLTSPHWRQVNDWDRTFYYKIRGGHQLSSGIDPESIEPIEVIPKRATPKGLIEKLTWKFLSPKQRALTRAAGGTNANFLYTWIKITVIFGIVGWLVHLEIPMPFAFLKIPLTIAFMFFGATAIASINRPSSRYLGSFQTSSQSDCATFQVFPIGIASLEDLHWKEGLAHWPLLSLSVALPFSLITSSASLGSGVLILSLHLIPIVIIIHTMIFWFRCCATWPPPLSNKGLRILVVKLVIFSLIIVLIPMVGLLLSLATLGEVEIVPQLLLFSVATTVIGIVVLRILIRGYIQNPRRDLMKQV